MSTFSESDILPGTYICNGGVKDIFGYKNNNSICKTEMKASILSVSVV